MDFLGIGCRVIFKRRVDRFYSVFRAFLFIDSEGKGVYGFFKLFFFGFTVFIWMFIELGNFEVVGDFVRSFF